MANYHGPSWIQTSARGHERTSRVFGQNQVLLPLSSKRPEHLSERSDPHYRTRPAIWVGSGVPTFQFSAIDCASIICARERLFFSRSIVVLNCTSTT